MEILVNHTKPLISIIKIFVVVLQALVSVQACYNPREYKCEPILRSCKDIQKRDRTSPSGIYTISTNVGPLEVYCEMEANGGGYTFLPESSITPDSQLDLADIYSGDSNVNPVLLRFQKANGEQPFTALKNLPQYNIVPLSVQINAYEGYTRPAKTDLGPFLYLGFIPADLARAKNTQGIQASETQITFTNCDRNPNSYFALYPVSIEADIKQTGYTLHTRALNTAVNVPSYAKMPTNYFFFAEMHFGGCGLYFQTNQWAQVNGLAIGLR